MACERGASDDATARIYAMRREMARRFTRHSATVDVAVAVSRDPRVEPRGVGDAATAWTRVDARGAAVARRELARARREGID